MPPPSASPRFGPPCSVARAVARRSLPWLAAALLSGCRSLAPAPALGSIIPIYASQWDAQAIAAGQFGAVPIAMAGEDEVALASAPLCGKAVAEVRWGALRQGWTPVGSLPARLLEPGRSSGGAAGPSSGRTGHGLLWPV